MSFLAHFLLQMGTTIEVLFDKLDKTYNPGDTVCGIVVIQSDEQKHLKLIRGTRVRCKGLSIVDLKFGEESGASLSNVSFIDEEAKVFTDKLTKTETKKGSIDVTKYEYPFRFILPKDIPSSFKTPFGRMEYYFKVTVPSGVAVSYFEGIGHFTVVGNLDLNQRPELNKPIEIGQEAMVKTLITEGTVSFSIKLPRRGYAIGDKILLHQEIKNNCKQSVTASISLIQKISHKFGQVSRLDKKNKVKVFGKNIGAHATDICDEEIFDIPSLPVTSVTKLKDDKKSVSIEYFLKYEIVAKPLWLKKFKSYIPLVIGSVPLKNAIN